MALKVLNIDDVQLDKQVACNASNHICIWVQPYRLWWSTILVKGLVSIEQIQVAAVSILYMYHMHVCRYAIWPLQC